MDIFSGYSSVEWVAASNIATDIMVDEWAITIAFVTTANTVTVMGSNIL
jgi:hypothetical protein